MSYSSIITIYERNGWRVISYGNGAAYALHDDTRKVSTFFQGDDADIFRSEVMDEGGWLIDSCEERFADYSDVMQPEEQAR